MISIIIPVYNSKSLIERTLDGLTSQKTTMYEIIVIDGGSTDGTLDVVRQYSSVVSVCISEPDNGIYDAMNKGIAHATGDIVAFLGAGDYLLDDSLSHVANVFENNPDIDIYCGEVYKKLGDDLQKRNNPFANNSDNLRYGMIYCHQAVFARKTLFERIGNFNTKYKIAADYDWLLRAYYQSAKFFYEKYYLTVFDYTGVSSRKLINMTDESLCIAKDNDTEGLYTKEIYHQYYQNYINAFVKENRKCSEICKKKIVNEIPRDKDIFLFGAGDLGRNTMQLLQNIGVTVRGIFDNSEKKNGTEICGVKVGKPIACKDNVFIIITSQYYGKEISVQLEELGYVQPKNYIYCDFVGRILEETICP